MGAYDRRLVNDRLLLVLKGTMSVKELSLMRSAASPQAISNAGRAAVFRSLQSGSRRANCSV